MDQAGIANTITFASMDLCERVNQILETGYDPKTIDAQLNSVLQTHPFGVVDTLFMRDDKTPAILRVFYDQHRQITNNFLLELETGTDGLRQLNAFGLEQWSCSVKGLTAEEYSTIFAIDY